VTPARVPLPDLTGARALVTGAGGFVGRHLCRTLLERGVEVWGTVRPGTAAPDGVRPLPVDLTDGAGLSAAVRQATPDLAFHLAAARAKGTGAERLATTLVNAVSGVHLVEALPASCRAVVRLGSSTEYAASDRPMDEDVPLRPRGFFGAGKAAGSLLLTAAAQERGLRSVVLRAFQVYGPGDHPGRFVPAVLRAAADGLGAAAHRAGAAAGLGARRRRRARLPAGGRRRRRCRPGRCSTSAPACRPPTRSWSPWPSRSPAGRSAPGGRPPRARLGRASWVCDPALAGRLLGLAPALDLRTGLARTWAAGRLVRVAVVVPVYGNAPDAARAGPAAGGGAGRARLDGPAGGRRLARRQRRRRRAAGRRGPRVVAQVLPRNLGQHGAWPVGLAEDAGADVWVCLDADLQDPPEAVPVLPGALLRSRPARRRRLRRPPRLVRVGAAPADRAAAPGRARPAHRPAARRRGVPAARTARARRGAAAAGAEPGGGGRAARLPTASVPVQRAERAAGRSAWTGRARVVQSLRTLAWTARSRLRRD
jgi:hypothetical protein